MSMKQRFDESLVAGGLAAVAFARGLAGSRPARAWRNSDLATGGFGVEKAQPWTDHGILRIAAE
jgi:hypothetical protein